MKKYIVLSVNDNPDYLFFTPLTCWAWRKFGWEPIVMYRGKMNAAGMDLVTSLTEESHWHWVDEVPPYRSDTVTQISRLYPASFFSENAYLMTGDIDMIPLSDYWKPDYNAQTVWGHDLTGYGHFPICYVGMMSDLWRVVMRMEMQTIAQLIKRDLDALPQARDTDFYKYWFTDQDLITERLKPYNPVIINRGQYSNGYAVGRVDRGSWSLNHSQFIDCHMFQQLYHKGNQDKFDKTMELLTSIWPDEDFGWFVKYTEEFRKLTGHV